MNEIHRSNLKELAHGLEAGKELHHKDWEEHRYYTLVDKKIVDNNGCEERFSKLMANNYLDDFYIKI